MTKNCSKCKIQKDLLEFYSDKRASDGKQSQCKACYSAYQTSEKRKTDKREKYNPNKRKISYESGKEKHLFRGREYYKENKQQIRNRIKAHYESNKWLYNSYTRKRQAAQLKATPHWLTDAQLQEMQYFYWLAKDLQAVTGEKYHVDHICPLQGKTSCGLHVPWNLQVIPSDLNLSKGNKLLEKL